MAEKIGAILIGIACLAVFIAFFLLDPIPQSLEYHNFSDTNSYGAIPNALNVLSNIPFLIVGLLGLFALRVKRDRYLVRVNRIEWSYYALFCGTALVGLGSAYYHLYPDNHTLVWDRIPMTIAFMGLYSIIIGEHISEKLGRLLLIPLLVLGLSSVFYWWFTESGGAGDLRFYAVIQFFPLLTIPIILIFFKSSFNYVWAYWALLATYVAAKVFETFDRQIYDYLGVISGHSIKHMLPAIGMYILIYAYRKRVFCRK